MRELDGGRRGVRCRKGEEKTGGVRKREDSIGQ